MYYDREETIHWNIIEKLNLFLVMYVLAWNTLTPAKPLKS